MQLWMGREPLRMKSSELVLIATMNQTVNARSCESEKDSLGPRQQATQPTEGASEDSIDVPFTCNPICLCT